MIKFVYYFIIPLCIMADIIRKPIQMVGFGVLGAGSGLIAGISVATIIIYINDGIGYVRSGFQSDPVRYKPLNETATNIIIGSSIYVAMAGGVAGITFGAIV
jgi:hypothetical protein